MIAHFTQPGSRVVAPRSPAGLRDDGRDVLKAASLVLRQGEEVLCSLATETYTRRVAAVFDGSIGGHFRHCLDHFASVVEGLDTGCIDYDARRRDPVIETQVGRALALTRRMRARLEGLPERRLSVPVTVRCEVNFSPAGRASETTSTPGRELVYCIMHAIHHYALIAVIARLQRVKLPDHFGVAPSTLASRAAGTGAGGAAAPRKP